jgi:dUTP pyrophosphatase
MSSYTVSNSSVQVIEQKSLTMVDIKILPMYSDVTMPFYATSGSAGCDVRAYLTEKNGYPTGKLRIQSGETIAIPTALKFQLPEGYEMQIRPRSGLSLKTKLRVANSPGTLDCDFLGQLMIILDNISINSEAIIDHGDRIAQLVFAPVTIAKFNIVTELGETERGENGFGSTGKN